jgi:hypothetical protein
MALMYGGPPPRAVDHHESCQCRTCKIKRALDAPIPFASIAPAAIIAPAATPDPVFDGPAMAPCSKCQRHIRIGEVCPWCHAEAVKPECTQCKYMRVTLAGQEVNLARINEELRAEIATLKAKKRRRR